MCVHVTSRHQPAASRRAVVACPRCGSNATTLLSQFGSTACKAQYRCDDASSRSTTSSRMSAMSKFHPLPIASVERETRDAVADHLRGAGSAARAVPLRAGPAPDAARRHRRRRRAPLVFDLLGGAGRRAAHRGEEEPRRRFLDVGERGAQAGRHDRRDAAARPLQRAARRDAPRATTLAFAAGSGITPLLSIIKTTLAAEPRSRFTLVYGNRASSTVMFKEELAALKDTLPRPLQPRSRAVARGAGHRAPARPHRPREGRRAARALGDLWRRSTQRSSAVPRA